MTGYVYTLRKKDCNDIFYIGSTDNLKERFSGLTLPSNRNDIIMEVLDEVEFSNKAELRNEEKFWIEQFRQWGFVLKNRHYNLSFRYTDDGSAGIYSKSTGLCVTVVHSVHEAHIRAAILIYLLEKKLITAEEVNKRLNND